MLEMNEGLKIYIFIVNGWLIATTMIYNENSLILYLNVQLTDS